MSSPQKKERKENFHFCCLRHCRRRPHPHYDSYFLLPFFPCNPRSSTYLVCVLTRVFASFLYHHRYSCVHICRDEICYPFFITRRGDTRITLMKWCVLSWVVSVCFRKINHKMQVKRMSKDRNGRNERTIKYLSNSYHRQLFNGFRPFHSLFFLVFFRNRCDRSGNLFENSE